MIMMIAMIRLTMIRMMMIMVISIISFLSDSENNNDNMNDEDYQSRWTTTTTELGSFAITLITFPNPPFPRNSSCSNSVLMRDFPGTPEKNVYSGMGAWGSLASGTLAPDVKDPLSLDSTLSSL